MPASSSTPPFTALGRSVMRGDEPVLTISRSSKFAAAYAVLVAIALNTQSEETQNEHV